MLIPGRPVQSNHNASLTFDFAGKQMLCLTNQKRINSGRRSFCKGLSTQLSHDQVCDRGDVTCRPGRTNTNASGRGVLSMHALSYGVVRVDSENNLTSLTLQDCGQVLPGGQFASLIVICYF